MGLKKKIIIGALALYGLMSAFGCGGSKNNSVVPQNKAPVVSNIADFSLEQGKSKTFNLDDYVADEDNKDSEITWGYSGNNKLQLNYDSATRQLTISAPALKQRTEQVNLYSEKITLTAADPSGLKGSDDITVNVYDNDIAPLPCAVLDKNSGNIPFDVNIDASCSSDSDGSIAKYEADCDGDGVFDKTNTTANLTCSYNSKGTFTPTLKVTDDLNVSETTTLDSVVASEYYFVSGTVKDVLTQQGINNLEVKIWNTSDSYTTTTDANGIFSLENLKQSGDYNISIKDEDLVYDPNSKDTTNIGNYFDYRGEIKVPATNTTSGMKGTIEGIDIDGNVWYTISTDDIELIPNITIEGTDAYNNFVDAMFCVVGNCRDPPNYDPKTYYSTGVLTRWGSYPIPVYIEDYQEGGIDNDNIVRDAMSAWETKVGQSLFTEVSTESEASNGIVVDLNASSNEICALQIDPTSYNRSYVNICLLGCGTTACETELLKAAKHEFGHALSLSSESLSNYQIMGAISTTISNEEEKFIYIIKNMKDRNLTKHIED